MAVAPPAAGTASAYAKATTCAIVACIEMLRGWAVEARNTDQPVEAMTLDDAADALWRDRQRIAEEAIAAFGDQP